MATPFIFFDMAGTIMSSNINWERENRAGIELVVSFLKELGKPILDTMTFIERFLADARLHRRRAKEERIEYRVRELLLTHIARENITVTRPQEDELVLRYVQPEIDRTMPYEGMADLLETLRAAGATLVVLSNSPSQEFVEIPLTKYGLLSYFSSVITSCAIGFRKPHPFFLNRIVEEIKPNIANSVLVGDRLYDDIVSGQRMGMKTIFLNIVSHADNAEYKGKIIPDYEVSSIATLSDILFSKSLGLFDKSRIEQRI